MAGALYHLRPVLLLTAWTCIALAAILYIVGAFMIMTPVWISDFWYDSDLKGWYSSKTEGFGLYPPVIMYAFFTKTLVFSWVPLCFITLLAIWQRNWPFRASKSEVGSFDASEIAVHEPKWWRTFKHQGHLFFTYQLPPRKLWTALIEDGFNVIDLIVVLLWFGANFAWLWFSFYLYWPYMEAYYAENGTYEFYTLMGDYTEALGYASAWAAAFNLLFMFIPISRMTFLQYLFNSDFSSIIRYHRWLGHGTLWMSLWHGLFFYIGWWSISTEHFRTQTFAWQPVSVNYLAGSIAFFPFGLVLWIGTIPIIRRKFFKVFLASHIIGFLGFMVFVTIHYVQTLIYVPGLVLYFLDVTFRLAQWRVQSGVQCSFVSADRSFATLKLKFNKDAKVRSNQFVFVNAPSIAYWQWHPISIAAVYPGADGQTQDVILHVKAYGAWSRNLITKLSRDGTIPVRADGPYGSASAPEWTQYDHIVMVAGGIGITPLLSMLREIQGYHRAAQAADSKLGPQQAVPGLPASVNLIWAVKKRDELQLLDQDLLMTAGQSGSWLSLNLFHTSPGDDYVEPSNPQNGAVSQGAQHPPAPITHGLQPYGFGDFHWALAHLLAFFGTVFCVILSFAYNYEGAVTGNQDGEGIKIWTWAFITMLAFLVGSMGFPALIIFPLQAIRYKKHVRKCEVAHAEMAEMGHGAHNGHHNAGNGHAKMSPEQARNLMPENGARAGALDLETGKSASVSSGRPHLKKIITESIAGLSPHQRLGIIASGPSSLVRDSRAATHSASRIAAKAGLSGIPELSFSNHSFAL